jgi:hypothetical protein
MTRADEHFTNFKLIINTAATWIHKDFTNKQMLKSFKKMAHAEYRYYDFLSSHRNMEKLTQHQLTGLRSRIKRLGIMTEHRQNTFYEHVNNAIENLTANK